MPKLSITDTRMLKLMEITIQSGKVNSESEYAEKVGFFKTNLPNIRAGRQSFTRDHIRSACKFTGASADWIFALSDEIYRKPPKTLKGRLQAIINEMEE